MSDITNSANGNIRSNKYQLTEANANQAIEGFHPDASDLEIQARFVDGLATTSDMLEHAHDFVKDIQGKDAK